MQAPEALRARLRTAWSRQRREWLRGGGNWPLALSTQPPTEAQAMAAWEAFGHWLQQWRDTGAAGLGQEVACRTVRWSRIGEQSLPERWLFDTPAAVATALGEGARWQRASQRYATLVAWASGRWPQVLAHHFDVLADYDDGHFQQLCRVVEWLRTHPQSGLYPRQLPVPGIDSKWLESHRAVVVDWVAAMAGIDGGDFYATTGLRAAPDRLRMRVLDPALRAQLRGLSDIEAPLDDFIALQLAPRQVLVVENLVTGLALGDVPGAVAFMRRGYAVEPLAQLPWILELPLTYWGDLDSHGFAILDRLRSHLPRARSLLMDADTLAAHHVLRVPEPSPHPAPALPLLTPAEQAVFDSLRGDRLEQERIAWGWAWPRLVEALAAQAADKSAMRP